MPQHHFHMSSSALFIVGLFAFAILVTVLAFVSSMRAERRRDKRRERERRAFLHDYATGAKYEASPSPSPNMRIPGFASGPAPTFSPGGVYYPAPQAPHHPVTGADVFAAGALGLTGGALLGAAMAGNHHTTVINEGPTFVEPSYSGIDYDAGGCVADSGGIDLDF